MKPPRIVKLIICLQDMEEGAVLSMYNVIREGLNIAIRIISRGGAVRIECCDQDGGISSSGMVDNLSEFMYWKDHVNRVVLSKEPIMVPIESASDE